MLIESERERQTEKKGYCQFDRQFPLSFTFWFTLACQMEPFSIGNINLHCDGKDMTAKWQYQ